MAAIITTDFRLNNAKAFKTAVTSESVYLSIGKSDPWSTTLGVADTLATVPPTPVDTQVEKTDFWQSAIALKKVDSSSVTHIVPRYNWVAGSTYVAWDDADADIFTKNFYVITPDEYKVYKCTSILPTATTVSVKPTHDDTVNPVNGGDGYFWKYMYTLSAQETASFLTNSYMPVKTVVIPTGGVIGDLSVTDQTRYLYQQNSAANVGKLYRIVVTNPGSGYTGSAPSVLITGDGSAAAATAYLNGSGGVSHILINNNGANYTNVKVTLTGGTGTGATARAVLSPPGGHGTDPVGELGGVFIGMRVVLTGAEGGDFIVNGGEFRQLGIIRNPTNYGTTTTSTATTLSALKTITLGAGSVGGFIVGDVITGGVTGAKAYVDSFDSATGIIKYHQNDKTGYTAFSTSPQDGLAGVLGGSGTVGSLGNPEVNKFSGTVIFVENRTALKRSASQLEDIKVIVEF